ncbi:2-phospho-L-lactate transferase CofD family protein [Janibacter sp. DB-40]|uniref:2-phospho-L-lactate transferase CofD family protein n=1 Tax=Janibacter sp. DB-40 TaxID=3028808 RepID=UPI0024050D9D|nr:2-phospho-L-lactate transferase CofD family protein [Janibacter sp. DB-40]
MRITVISGGEPGARFTRGLLDHLEHHPDLGGAEVTVIANTGDDISLWGLRLCPDLDLLVEALGTAGGAGSSHVVGDELAALGLEPQWYPVSDREMGVHVARTAWLGRGDSLSQVTAHLARTRGVPDTVRILPMSDVPVETHVVLDGPEDQRAVHVQQWRRELASPGAARFVVAGLDRAHPGTEVLDAVRSADVVLLPPSDPVLALGIVLGVPGVRDALRGTSAPVVGVSPVVDDVPAPQPLAASLATVGVVTSGGVAGLFKDLLDGWVVDPADAGAAPAGSRWATAAHTAPLAESAPADVAATALAHALSLRS